MNGGGGLGEVHRGTALASPLSASVNCPVFGRGVLLAPCCRAVGPHLPARLTRRAALLSRNADAENFMRC